MRQTNKAVRRHHASRIKKRRGKYYGSRDKTPRELGMLLHTAKLCSCWMCCNPRKNGELSIQECSASQNIDQARR